MAFFLIVPSVMVVSILLIHALAKRLGLQLYYSTLISTAIVSFMIIFAAVILSPAPDKKFFLCLGGLILITSFVLTLINNFLIKKQRDEEKIFTEQVKAAYAEEIKKDLAKSSGEENSAFYTAPDKKNVNESYKKIEVADMPVENNDSFYTTPDKENVNESFKKIAVADMPVEDNDSFYTTPDKENIIEDTPAKESKPEKEFPLENVFKPLNEVKAEAVAKALQDKSAAPFDEPKPEEDFPLQEVFNPLDEDKSEATKKALQDESAPLFDEPKPEEDFPLQETFKALDEVKPDVLKKIQSEVKPRDLPEPLEEVSTPEVEVAKSEPLEEISTPTVEVTKPEPQEEISTPEVEVAKSEPQEEISTPEVEVAKSEPQEEISSPTADAPESEPIETLDSILDKAYDARAKGYMWQAMAFYKKALERYNNDEYAPFVAIDLGNIYKENALYSKAIKVYEDALKLPAVGRNAETKREFAKNLEYLRVVRDVLFKRHIASTPFNKIPREILQEIDAEFQKTQLHAV